MSLAITKSGMKSICLILYSSLTWASKTLSGKWIEGRNRYILLALCVDLGEWASLAKVRTTKFKSLVWMMKAKQPASIGVKIKVSHACSSKSVSVEMKVLFIKSVVLVSKYTFHNSHTHTAIAEVNYQSLSFFIALYQYNSYADCFTLFSLLKREYKLTWCKQWLRQVCCSKSCLLFIAFHLNFWCNILLRYIRRYVESSISFTHRKSVISERRAYYRLQCLRNFQNNVKIWVAIN